MTSYHHKQCVCLDLISDPWLMKGPSWRCCVCSDKGKIPRPIHYCEDCDVRLCLSTYQAVSHQTTLLKNLTKCEMASLWSLVMYMCEVHTTKGSEWSKHVCELTTDVLLVKVSPLITTLAETETNSVAMWLCQVLYEQTQQHCYCHIWRWHIYFLT